MFIWCPYLIIITDYIKLEMKGPIIKSTKSCGWVKELGQGLAVSKSTLLNRSSQTHLNKTEAMLNGWEKRTSSTNF